MFSVTRAEQMMRDIAPPTDRLGVGDSALRLLGQIRSELEYRPIADIIDDLPTHMDSVQAGTSAASEAIRQRYFPTNDVASWVGDSS
jgi:A predicted alpha-helical domain with a conserved ER motif.